MKETIDYAYNLHTEDRQMLKEELEIIADWCAKYYKGGNTLEIGAYKGMTSYVMLASMLNSPSRLADSKHFIVDIFEMGIEDTEWRYSDHPMETLVNNLGDYAKYANVIKSTSLGHKALAAVLPHRFDYVYIDGDHRYEVLFMELMLAESVADKILGHDYPHPGVKIAVDRFCKERGYTLSKPNGAYGLFELTKI